MSIRTIIEINHDFLSRLGEDDHAMAQLIRAVTDNHTGLARTKNGCPPPNGIRILGCRHHSEKLKLEIE